MRDQPLMRDHCCSNFALHFYTFVPAMKDHLSHKITFCGPMGWSLITGFTVLKCFKEEQWQENIPEICRVPESKMAILWSRSMSGWWSRYHRIAGDGLPELWHCNIATLLTGNVWFCGPWWMIGGGRGSTSINKPSSYFVFNHSLKTYV